MSVIDIKLDIKLRNISEKLDPYVRFSHCDIEDLLKIKSVLLELLVDVGKTLGDVSILIEEIECLEKEEE